jgi:hemoglobin
MLCRRLRTLRLLALASIVAIANSASAAPDAPGSPSLYDRIGGGAMLTSIARNLIDASAADPRTARSWDKVGLERVKSVLAEYLCSIAGGPCVYQGDTMKQIHAGMNITQTEMYAMVEMLRDIMIKEGVPLRERNELLARLAPSKRDVVTK